MVHKKKDETLGEVGGYPRVQVLDSGGDDRSGASGYKKNLSDRK